MKTILPQGSFRFAFTRSQDHPARNSALWGLAAGLLLSAAATQAIADARDGSSADAVAVSARASSDYTRTRLADGSLAPETFAFANGGALRSTEAGMNERIGFMDVARTIARPLGSQGYLPSTDPKTTRLLIVVYWGATTPPSSLTQSIAGQNLAGANAAALAANHPQMVRNNPNDSCAPPQIALASTTSYAIRSPDQIDLDAAMTGALAAVAAEEQERRMVDARNAGMLGFDASWTEASSANGTALEGRQNDILGELEAPRYFVVLMAYDFQLMWKQKKAKLLWETRFSVREGGNDFGRQLDAMASGAARYFGQNTGRLVHESVPDGHVEIGPVRAYEGALAQ